MDSGIRIKGGALIIGSLLWDSSEIRKKWREEDLNLSDKIQIKFPIRYGRISKSRNFTHSMVYSSACKEEGKLGNGYFVPFFFPPLRVSEGTLRKYNHGCLLFINIAAAHLMNLGQSGNRFPMPQSPFGDSEGSKCKNFQGFARTEPAYPFLSMEVS